MDQQQLSLKDSLQSYTPLCERSVWLSQYSKGLHPNSMMNQSQAIGLEEAQQRAGCFPKEDRSSKSEHEEQYICEQRHVQNVLIHQQSELTQRVLLELKVNANIARALLKIKGCGLQEVNKTYIIIPEEGSECSAIEDMTNQQQASGDAVPIEVPPPAPTTCTIGMRARRVSDPTEEQGQNEPLSAAANPVKSREVRDDKELSSLADERKTLQQPSPQIQPEDRKQSAAGQEDDVCIRLLNNTNDRNHPLHHKTSTSTSPLNLLHTAVEQRTIAKENLKKERYPVANCSNTKEFRTIEATDTGGRKENAEFSTMTRVIGITSTQKRNRGKPRKSVEIRQHAMQTLMKRLSHSESETGLNGSLDSLGMEMKQLSEEREGNWGPFRNARLVCPKASRPLHEQEVRYTAPKAGSTNRKNNSDTPDHLKVNPGTKKQRTTAKRPDESKAAIVTGVGGNVSPATSGRSDPEPRCMRPRGEFLLGGGVRRRYTHLQKELTCKYRKKGSVEDPYEEALLSQVGPYDVLCDRNPRAFDHVGNRRFRITCQIYARRYKDAIDNGTKSNRTALMRELLSTIVQAGGRFLSAKSGTWDAVSLKKKKEKVGHAIRNAVTDIELAEAECAVDDNSEDIEEPKVSAESLVLLGAVAEKLANDEVPIKLSVAPRNLSQPTRSLEPNEVLSASAPQQQNTPTLKIPESRENSDSSRKKVTFAPSFGRVSAANLGIWKRQHLHEASRITTELNGHCTKRFTVSIPQVLDIQTVKLRMQPRHPRLLRVTPRVDLTNARAKFQANFAQQPQQLQRFRGQQAWESLHEQSDGDNSLYRSMTGSVDAATDASPNLVSSSGQPQLPLRYKIVELQRQNAPMPQSLLAQSMRGEKIHLPAPIYGAVVKTASMLVSGKKRPLSANYIGSKKHNIKSLRSKLPRLDTSPFARKIPE